MAFDARNSRPFPVTTGDIKRVLEPMNAPINKVGLVLLRNLRSNDPEVCLVQVKAKNPAEQDRVDFGLPKGTRHYYDRESNSWKDARDSMTAQLHRDALEPLDEALMQECEEELGLDPKLFARTPLHELGLRAFAPRDGSAAYDIHWCVMEATPQVQASMNPNPCDAHAVKWFKMSEVAALADAQKINPNYPAVMNEAVTKFRADELRPALFAEPTKPTR